MHVINAVKTRYKYSLAEGGEMVGPLAAQSLGEKTTQMTLHSVDWETEILIAKNGDIITPKIGEFIDSYYEECLKDPIRKKKIQYINDGKQIYIPLDDGNDWRAYSCDEDGKVMWTKLEAITRHPVVNEDGSETILEVELECGRIVKATKGKSFLVYNEAQNKVIEINGSELQVGDLLPVCNPSELDGESLGLEDYSYKNTTNKVLQNYDNILKIANLYNSFKKYDKKFQDVNLHKVSGITEILPTSKIYNGEEQRFVYDLTVANTKNFCTSDLLCVRDTFHLKIGFHHPYAEWDRQAPKGYAA
jgi:intein/homing endonuclease